MALPIFDHKNIEEKWQGKWEESKIFHAQDLDKEKPKFYALSMFPYPSAAGLHVGHPEGYTATDIVARFKRMKGFNVLQPMGYDAFGLPAENYAIETGIHPAIKTEENITTIRRQIKSLGFSYDWSREVNTTDPEYYKWTQWIFSKIFEKGLAYRTLAPINFCPKCKTGLANEEVHNGRCERCGSAVEKRSIHQWVLKITMYADRLLGDMDKLDWPISTLTMQNNWIGKSNGAEIDFMVDATRDPIRVFTTRPDTLFGATYMVLAPEHPLVSKLATPGKSDEVKRYQETSKNKSDIERSSLAREKTGVYTGTNAINPVNNEKIPIWISDYVMLSYGTGAIMCVPAHDERDWEFANKFSLPVRQVVKPDTPTNGVYTGDGIAVNSGEFNGLTTDKFKESIIKWLENKKIGKKTVTYKLRDWIFSRQRYWGEPIPIVHCQDKCGSVLVPEKELPLLLPDVKHYEPSGTGESPLASIKDWVQTKCPKCNGKALRETDTMPQWAGSCWYYLRYLDPHSNNKAWDADKERYWMPVDLYIGGAEHAVLHLLYARFWHKVLHDLGLVSTEEPFIKLRHQGMILAYSFQDKKGAYQPLYEIEHREGKPYNKKTNELLTTQIEKMSKSKKNVVNPDDIVATYGADAMRLYEMFMGDFELPKPWDMRTVEGVVRFINKVWRIVDNAPEKGFATHDENISIRHKTIKNVEERINTFKFNTAISAMMEYVNALIEKGASKEDAETLIKLLSPFAPHVCEELWAKLGNKPFVSLAKWPVFDEKHLIAATMPIAVQVNGKFRDVVNIETDKSADKELVQGKARSQDKVARHLQNAKVLKVIYIQGKAINFVVKADK
ncbi:leucine--tRNA ligase [Elusimicrobiota bacterium]